MFLIDWCFGSCHYIVWYSGSCLTSIGDLVRAIYRLVLWFVFYFNWWCSPCFVWTDALVRVAYRCLCKWMLHWEDVDVTLQGAQKRPVKDGGAHVWKALGRGESGHDSLPLRGPTCNTYTHTHTVFCVKCTTVSGWQFVKRGGLNLVCEILRRFAWNSRPSGKWNINLYSVAGVSNKRGYLQTADPRRNPFRTFVKNGWKRLLGYIIF